MRNKYYAVFYFPTFICEKASSKPIASTDMDESSILAPKLIFSLKYKLSFNLKKGEDSMKLICKSGYHKLNKLCRSYPIPISTKIN